MNINNYMLISLNRISKKHGYTVTEITNIDNLSKSKLNLPTIKEGLNKGYNYKEDKKRESVIEDIILIKPDIPRRKYRQITEEQLDSLNLILDN